MISLSANRKNTAWLKTKDGSVINSSEQMKLLGFVFSESLNCNEQVTNLITKPSKRKYLLLQYAQYMPGKDLKKLYCALVRSLLEYSSPTIATQLSKYQSNRLENILKQCLSIMFGSGRSYEDLLKESGLEDLSVRRRNQFCAFAENAVSNPVYSHWFPLNENRLGTRNRKTYEEKTAKTDRLYKSPVYAMRRHLNGTPDSDRFNDPRFVDLSHLFNDPRN